MAFPKPSEVNRFYGDPRGPNGQASGAWVKANLTRITPPFVMRYDGKPVASIVIHKKCADSLQRVLARIWDAAGRSQKVIDAWGVSTYAGSFNYRIKRGGSSLSMHAYGVALDLDPARNAFRDDRPNFANVPQVVKAFEDEGWTWGGRWKGRSCDGMHFEATKPNYVVPEYPRGSAPVNPLPVSPGPQVEAPPRVTRDELKAAGSRTISAVDAAKTATLGGGGAIVAADALVSTAQDFKQTVDSGVATVEQGRNLLGWFAGHWQWFAAAALIGVAGFFVWRVWRALQAIEHARVDDANSGAHEGRVIYRGERALPVDDAPAAPPKARILRKPRAPVKRRRKKA